MTELREWESFYVIVGTAAGTLIGLQFVVITLIAERPPPRAGEASSAFSTPTIVHFSTVLLLSALVRIPWHSVMPLALLWGIVGLAGVIYGLIVFQRARTQTAYRPDFEDWLFHVGIPLVAYAGLVVAAIFTHSHLHDASLGVGAVVLVLLFVAIHNAWDGVSYLVFTSLKRDEKKP